MSYMEVHSSARLMELYECVVSHEVLLWIDVFQIFAVRRCESSTVPQRVVHHLVL
jgi:hypothetical protein